MFPHSHFVMYEDFRENEIANAGRIKLLADGSDGEDIAKKYTGLSV